MPARAAPREPAAPAPQPARSAPPAEPAKSAQAATVMQAGRSSAGGGGSGGGILRTRPLFVFSIVAGLIAVAYGGYVYIQLTNPGICW